MATSIAPSRVKRAPARSASMREALNMRIQPDLRELIDQAAEITGKNRTDFVLDAARQAAQTTLLDQIHVRLNPEAFAAFLQRLEAPAQPNDSLRKTMQTPAPWE